MRKGIITTTGFAALTIGASAAAAQQGGAQGEQPFAVGQPLGVTVEGQFTPTSDNVRVFGSFRFAESCTYDEARNLIVVMNRGTGQNEVPNDGYVSLLNPDGSVHTTKWIGVNRNGLTLNDPLGSAVRNGVLYAADVNTVRTFDLATGQPLNAFEVAEATNLNGIAVTADGTVYASNTGGMQRIYRVTANGQSSVFVDGEPLSSPNGVAIDNDGNIVVVNIGNNNVLTFSPAGQLVRTEQAAQAGNDGVVIMPDGTKYVSSVREGGVSRIRPGQQAELIASGIPSAASMCYDPVQRQLIIPMNNHNAMAFLSID
jgi:hypothetical protein